MICYRSIRIVVLAMIGVLVPAAGRAQPPELMDLAGSMVVHRDLGLSDVSGSQLRQIAASFKSEIAGFRTGLPPEAIPAAQREELENLPATERAAKRDEIRMQVIREKRAQFAARAKAFLLPEQFERLHQIRRQVRGSVHLLDGDAEFDMGLALTKDQQDQIREINKLFAAKGQGLRGTGGGAAISAKSEELSNERNAKALELLTPEQRAKYAEMTGKPFDMTRFPKLPLSLGDPRPAPNRGDSKTAN